MTDRLSLYNGALTELGERELVSLSDNSEPRRLLDSVWGRGALDQCLEAGQWSFAMRSLEIAPSTSLDASFGYQHAYEIPSDVVRLTGVFVDDSLQVPLLRYQAAAGVWFADDEPIYVSYVSNDPAYGGDLSRWPAAFVRYVEAHLAGRVVRKITQNTQEWDRIYRLTKQCLLQAASLDAMNSPTRFLPRSGWVAAREGGATSRDRGSRGSLIG